MSRSSRSRPAQGRNALPFGPVPPRAERASRPAVSRLLLLTAVLLGLSGSSSADEPRPLDLVLVVDVSSSMIADWNDSSGSHKANDPAGVRWDGIQFALDVARPGDRVAIILFRAEAGVITKSVEESGFVPVEKVYPRFGGRSGREILKDIVFTDLQAAERRGYAEVISLGSLPESGPPRVDLKGGTSIIDALKSIDQVAWRPLGAKADRQVFLFTDGQDTTKPKQDDLTALLAKYREGNVAAFTFGLGEDIDRDLLRKIAEETRSGGNAGAETVANDNPFYQSRDSVTLVESLRKVLWEVRRYWVRDHLNGVRVDDDKVRVTTPTLGLGQDVGLMLFRDVAGAFRMEAPPGEPTLRAIQRGKSSLVEERIAGKGLWRRSRSHLYADLSANTIRHGVPVGGQIEVDVEDRGGEASAYQGVIAARPNLDLFRYDSPPQGARYTPKDGIPFRVTFLPNGSNAEKGVYQPSQFEVNTELRREDAPAGKPTVVTLGAPPDLPPGTDPRPQTFSADHVFDGDPDSKGNPRLLGTYTVDVVITAKGGPLAGLSRRLIRRTFKVGDYPGLVAEGRAIVLTNEGPGALKGETQVRLDQATSPAQDLARLILGPIVAPPVKTGRLTAQAFRVELIPPVVRGDGGRLVVDLPADAWSAIPAGKYPGGKVEVSAPWIKSGDRTTSVEVVVDKKRYDIRTAPRVQASLGTTGTPSTEVDVQAWLRTDLPVTEQIRLVDPGRTEGASADPGGPLEFLTLDGRGDPLRLRVEGLDRPETVSGGPDVKPATFRLKLKAVGPVHPGTFGKKFAVRGASTAENDSAVVEVRVLIDKPRFWRVQGGKKVEGDHLAAPGLAGTTVRRHFILRSSLATPSDGQEFEPLKDQPLRFEWAGKGRKGLDHFPGLVRAIDPRRGREPGLELEIAVPSRVLEGPFAAELKLPVTKVGGQSDVATMLVQLDVSHRGVKLEGGKSVRVTAGRDQVARGEVKLVATVDKGTFRWSVADDPTPAPPAKPLDRARVDILFDGSSVLAVGPGGGPEPPADPVIAPDKPCPLTVVCQTKGLEPGLYSRRMRFLARDIDDAEAPKATPGSSYDFEIVVTVPGRVVKAPRRVETDGPGASVGQPAKYEVEVESYGVKSPGQLRWVQLGEGGEKPSPAGNPASTADAATPDKRTDLFPVAITPGRAGLTKYRVEWAPDPERIVSSPASQPIEIKAVGRLLVSSHDENVLASRADLGDYPLVALHEPLLFRTEAVPGFADLTFTANPVQGDNRPDNSVKITLYDDGDATTHGDSRAGDGVYSALFLDGFSRAGKYKVAMSGQESLDVEPMTINAGFRLTRPPDQTIYYGGGFLGWFVPNHERARGGSLLLSNDSDGNGDWAVSVKYPKSESEIAKLIPSPTKAGVIELARGGINQVELGDDYDQNLHFPGKLSESGGGNEAPQSSLAGTLGKGQNLEIGLSIDIPDDHPVKTYLYRPVGPEPVHLRRSDCLVIHVTFREKDGKRVRDFLLPVLVTPSRLTWLVSASYGILAALGILVLALALAWYRRWAETRVAAVPDTRRRVAGLSDGDGAGRGIRKWLARSRDGARATTFDGESAAPEETPPADERETRERSKKFRDRLR